MLSELMLTLAEVCVVKSALPPISSASLISRLSTERSVVAFASPLLFVSAVTFETSIKPML